MAAPEPESASMVFVDTVDSQAVSQPPASSTGVSETTGTTQLILKLAASPGSTPQNAPSPDSSTASGADVAQEKVGRLADVSHIVNLCCFCVCTQIQQHLTLVEM